MRGALLALGFDQFDDDIAPLVGAANDARKTAALFELSLGYQVEVLTHEELNQRRGVSIARSIKRLLEPLGPGDVFGIFIATHGKSLPLPGGKGRGQVFLLPDASLHVLSAAQHDPQVYNALGAGFLTMAQVDLYTYKPGVRRFSMFDACRSPIERADALAAANRDGSALHTALFDNEAGYRDFALRMASGPRADSPLTIFNSCSDQELAAELPDQARGLFNLAVERVIRRRLAQGMAVVMDAAFNADVQQEMAVLAAAAGLHTGRQTPILQGQSLALCAPESAAQLQARSALLAEFETRFAAGQYYRPYGQSANDSLQRLAGMGLPAAEFSAYERRLTDAQQALDDARAQQREQERQAEREAAQQAAAQAHAAQQAAAQREAEAQALAERLAAEKQAAQAQAAQEAAKRQAAEEAARRAAQQAEQARAAQAAEQAQKAKEAEEVARAQAARTHEILEHVNHLPEQEALPLELAARRQQGTEKAAKLGWALLSVGLTVAVVSLAKELWLGGKEEPSPLMATREVAEPLPSSGLINKPPTIEPTAAGPLSPQAYLQLRQAQGAGSPAVLAAAQAMLAADRSAKALAQPGVARALLDLMEGASAGKVAGGPAAQAHWMMLYLLSPNCCQKQADLEAAQDQINDALWQALAAPTDAAAPTWDTLREDAERLVAQGESRWGSAVWAGMLAKCATPPDREAAQRHFNSLLDQPVPRRVAAGHAQAYQSAARQALNTLQQPCR